MPYESPSFKKLIEDKLGLNTFGIGSLRDIEWGKRYYWACRFIDPKPPAPFDNFFPASDVTIPVTLLNSFNFEQGQSSYKVPQRTEARDLTLTFYDDANHTLLTWLRNWIDVDILNNGQFVSCLKDNHPRLSPEGGRVQVCRMLEVTKLDNSLEPIKGETKVFNVYPEGALEFIGGSGSEANIYTVTFVIVGEPRPTVPAGENSFMKNAAKKGAQLLGRFF